MDRSIVTAYSRGLRPLPTTPVGLLHGQSCSLHNGLAMDYDIALAYSRCLLPWPTAVAYSKGLYLGLNHDLAIHYCIAKAISLVYSLASGRGIHHRPQHG